MHTIEEVEYIHRRILERSMLDQQELVYFACSLHELFLSVGLRSKWRRYGIPDTYHAYSSAATKEVRVMVGSYGWYAQIVVTGYSRFLMYTFDDDLPTDDIQRLIDSLQTLCKQVEAKEYCQPCHYSGECGDYCGLGIGPALGCTHRSYGG